MDVSCPACAARYTADDEKLRGKTARMRCKACNTVWLVSGPGAASVAPAAHGPIDKEPSTKRAAVVRKGAEREKRDLFAEREPDEGSIKQTLLPPPSFGFTGVGARNENSVLFRVDQLSAAARLKTPEPSSAPAPNDSDRSAADDEGVIDLKALASAPPRKIGLPVAPLFSEPPAVSLDVNDSVQRPRARPGSKLRLVGGIAAAAAVLVVAGFGVSLAFKSEEPVKHTAALVVDPPAAAVAPPAKVDPAAAPVVAADDAKDTTTDKETKEPASTKGKRGKRGKGKAAKGGVITHKAPVFGGKPAPKAADPCGCKGDFNCILACTAKSGK